jgi:signal transduction histidine kinase
MQFTASFPKPKLTRLPQGPLFLVAAFALLIVIALVSMALLDRAQQFRSNIDRVQSTQEMADYVNVLLRRMESGQRGYLLTDDPSFLAVYRESEPLIEPAVAALRGAIMTDPEQQAIWKELEPAIRGKLAEMVETLRLQSAGQKEAAIAAVREGAGLRHMAQVRNLIQRIKDNEARRLSSYYAESGRQERLLLGVNIVAVLLIITVATISVLMVRRANAAMAKAQAVLHDANAILEAKVTSRTAELQAANEEIQRFAYIVSHDLRSPLVNIMGFTTELEALKGEILQRLAALRSERADGAAGGANATIAGEDQTIADDFEEALSFIKASITKMDRLINAVLTISREGNRKLRPEEIDMTTLLTTLSQAMTHQAQTAGASIEIATLPKLHSDRLAIEQIFSNLLDNAVKYLQRDEPGQIRVKGRMEGSRVVIEVEDNGRGIEPRDQERIFELFRRAGRQDRPGEGMGLAHVRALVRRLGGQIDVRSTPGKGSTFRVVLPRILQQTPEKISA